MDDKQKQNMCIYTLKYYLAIKRNKALIHATARMNFKKPYAK